MSSLQKRDVTYIKNLFLTTILGGIIGVINYLFNIFIVRYTDSAVFSIFSAALGIIYLVQIPSTSIQSIVIKNVAKNKDANLTMYMKMTYISFGIIGAICSVVFFFSNAQISDLASIPSNLIPYLAITFFLSFLSPIAKGFLLGYEKVITVNLITLLETVLKFAMGFIAVKMGGCLELLILANALPALLTTVGILPFLKLNSTGKVIKNNYKDFILITLFYLLLTMPYTIDLVLVNESFRAEYSSVALLGKLVYFACVLTATVLFARLSNENNKCKQRKSLLISIVLACAIGLVISLLYFLFGDFIVRLTVGEQYLSTVPYLGIFGLCMTGFACVYMVANYFISKGVFSYLFVLFITSVLQIYLFFTRNDSLDMVIKNQCFVYVVFFLLSAIFLYFYFRREDRHEKS